ncbi:MAG: DEAD/DEAH box helicase, partial [Nitrospira sp.]|nr:DEAD/DEAH box helicase [Nitrospira sp.]
PKERDQRIKAAITLEGWPRAITDEAVRWLKQNLSTFAREDLRLRTGADRWELRPVEKTTEALLYHIPFKIFGPDIFRGMPQFDEMMIDPSRLFQQLPVLLETLTAAGIELLYHDMPLRSSRGDCSIHVERGEGKETGIDWFEIRPEIRCDGAMIAEADWRTALTQGGLIHVNGTLRVLDSHTVERLRAILDLTDTAQPGRSAVQIVRVPRLQILDWLALREQDVAVSLPAEDEAVLARLLRFKHIAAPPIPQGLRATLRPYQQDGYAWLSFLYEHRFGACLADDMGLGKTLQTICLLAAVREGCIGPPLSTRGPHLIVVPTSLLFNWEQELGRFAPDLNVRQYSGGEQPLDAKDDDIILATYGTVRRNIDVLTRTAFHIIVFDEAQAVKNILADTTAAVRRLTGRFKLTLTGTPLENHLGEYFSIIDLCVPGLLGEYDRFRTELKRAHTHAMDRLLRRTRPFILRRTKAEILQDLPPKIESETMLDLTDRQKALYQQTVAQVRSTIDDAYRTKTAGQAQFIALTAILKLRQVCLSPRLLTNREDEPSPKLSFLMERLPVLLDEGHSALVFSQFTGFLDLVEESCAKHHLPYHRLDGSTAAAARKDRVTAFQTSDRPSVFLLSLKAGGQGLNLTKASYVFHLDPWWNPAVESQASDRAHRIGQQRTVSIVRILMRHSIEEKMMALKQRKLELYDAVMAGAVRGSGQSVLTKTDFDFLLSPSGQ